VRAQEDRLKAKIRSSAEILALYRLMNEPETQRATIESDMGRNASFASPQLYGRQYVAWWETRNLRIAANIRATLQPNPQARVLAIIGATHKGYLDAYLDMMQDVRLIDAEQFLR
jgi:pheromone shutdown protein TraB